MEEASLPSSNDEVIFAAYNALAVLGVQNYFVEAQFKPYAHMGGKAEADHRSRKIKLTCSDGLKCATSEVLTGFALSLLTRLFRKRLPASNHYLAAFKAFNAKAATASLANTLRRTRGRTMQSDSTGKHQNLGEISEKILADYPEVFAGVQMPEVTWGWGASKRRLAYHDPAFNRVVVSNAFDNPRIPSFVLEYLLFHEFLHAKHEVRYERGRSLRRCVHPAVFKKDEKLFARYGDACDWIEKRL